MDTVSGLAQHLAKVAPGALVVAAVGWGGGLGLYGAMRLLRLPTRKVVRLVALLLLGASAYLAAATFAGWPGASASSLLGVASFVLAAYALSRWPTRRGYAFVRKRTHPRATERARVLSLAMRKHHRAFGWLVFATACAHAVYFGPRLLVISSREIATGSVALGLLGVLVVLGSWMEHGGRHPDRKRRTRGRMRAVHVAAALAFFAVLLLHV